MKRALLLSGSLGAGHDAYAKVFESSLAGRGWTTGTVDAMALLGQRGGSAGEAVFRAMLATPGLYRRVPLRRAAPGQPLGVARRRRRAPPTGAPAA